MAFGFLGSLANIPVLSKVRGTLGMVLPGGCDPWGSQSLGDNQSDRNGWDQSGEVTAGSLHGPLKMHWRIFLLIRMCPCRSSCRRWETAAPWCDLRDGPHRWRWDGARKPWIRLSRGELPPLSSPGPSAPVGATPAVGTVPCCPTGIL